MAIEQHPKNVELMLLQSEIMLFDGSYIDAENLRKSNNCPKNEEIFLQRANISSKQKNQYRQSDFTKALDFTDEPIEYGILLEWNFF